MHKRMERCQSEWVATAVRVPVPCSKAQQSPGDELAPRVGIYQVSDQIAPTDKVIWSELTGKFLNDQKDLDLKDLTSYAELNLHQNVHIFQLHISFVLRSTKQKQILAHTGCTELVAASQWGAMDRNDQETGPWAAGWLQKSAASSCGVGALTVSALQSGSGAGVRMDRLWRGL